MFRRHPLLSLVTFLYLGFVGWVTLTPQPLDGGTDTIAWALLRVADRFAALDWVTYAGIEFTANMLMFVPIGMFFLLLLGRRRWFVAILLGVALSIGIETAQALFFPTRVADVRDVVSNGAGAALGAIAVLVVTTPKAIRMRRDARRSAVHGRPSPALR